MSTKVSFFPDAQPELGSIASESKPVNLKLQG
jgi:hypothetical protein